MTAVAALQAASYFTLPSLECTAAQFLGAGPVLMLDVRDAGVATYFAERSIATVACDLARDGANEHRIPRTPSILIGCGAADAGREALAGALLWAISIAAPRADIAVTLPAGLENDEAQLVIRLLREARCEITTAMHAVLGGAVVCGRRGDGTAARIRYEGTCDDRYDGSLAFVNRQLLSHLHSLDSQMDVQSCANPLQSTHFGTPDITIRHYWPPVHARPQTRYFVHMQPWEFGSLPVTWRDGLRNVDEVWCYTEYVADIYRRAEFPADRIFRIPLGFEPAVFYPRRVAHSDECVFTYVGGLIHRKGADLAVAAFSKAFTASDNVRLIIKSHGGSTFYSRSQTQNIFAPLENRADAPRFTLIDQYLSEAEIAALYARSTAALVPFRGEGFGLPALEAMACGTPVVYTRGGALDDFCSAEYGYPIASQKMHIRYDQLETGPMLEHGFFTEADVDDMAVHLREIYLNRDEAARRGGAAAKYVHANWTWDHAAAKMHERLREISRMLGIR